MGQHIWLVLILVAVASASAEENLTKKCWKFPECPTTGVTCNYTHLNCTNIKIPHVPNNLLSQAYHGLLYLKLYQNGIVSIEHETFSRVTNLRVLILSYNSIENFKPRTFTKLRSLTYLDLSHNEFTALDEESLFFNQRHLRILLLNSNKISVLHDKLFKSLHKLTRLDLSNNRLKNMNENLFNSQENLEILLINSNLIGNISIELLSPLQSLKHLHMENNSFVCNCQLQSVRRWCDDEGIATRVTCEVKNGSWSKSSASENCEIVNIYAMSPYEVMDVMIVIIGVSVTLCVMFVGLALSYCLGRSNTKPVERINFRNNYLRFKS